MYRTSDPSADAGDLVDLSGEVDVLDRGVGLVGDDLATAGREDLGEDLGVVAEVRAGAGERDRPRESLGQCPLGGGSRLHRVVEADEERVGGDVGEARLGRGGEEHGNLAARDLQHGLPEVGERRADQELGAGVEQFLRGAGGHVGITLDVGDLDLDR